MPASLRILHCLRAPVGGLFRHVCDLAAEQAARGHLVGIIADANTGGAAAEARLTDLEPICTLGITRIAMSRLPAPGDALAMRRVLHLVRDLRPDVLHGHGAKGGLHVRLAGTWTGPDRPLRVYTPHGGSLHYGYASPAGALYLTAERLLARHTDLFLFESAYARRRFDTKVGDSGARGRVVHNGLAPAEFTPVPADADAADLVFVGEIRSLKGVDVLLSALARLSQSSRPATAVIVGAGAELDAMKARAAELGLASHVRFPGPMPAQDAFRLGRCLVVPSRAESLPYVVLEGAAARLPILATDVGGVPEIFGSQADQLLPPGDPDRLAEAIMGMLRDAEAARHSADALARRVAEHFTIHAMTDGILAAYRAAIQQPGVKPS